MKQIYFTTKAKMNPFSERRDVSSERRELFRERERKFDAKGFRGSLQQEIKG